MYWDLSAFVIVVVGTLFAAMAMFTLMDILFMPIFNFTLPLVSKLLLLQSKMRDVPQMNDMAIVNEGSQYYEHVPELVA